MKTVCVLPGDGIGPEVIGSAEKILVAASNSIEFVRGDIGESSFKKYGTYLTKDALGLMKSCDSCLFGAVTSKEAPDYDSPVLRFRKELDLYANLRPVRTLVRMPSREPIDVVIIRENSEGMYTQDEVYDDKGVTTMRRVSKLACERIVSFAIGQARKSMRRKITCVHKANVLRASDGLFLTIFRDMMRSDGKDLTASEQLVDSAAMRLLTEPSSFDVIVTLNLYGDILSDVAAGVAGGLGFAPSGNIGPKFSVFEPAHGSAPDIMGKGVANPTAATLAGAMMLRHLGLQKDAETVEHAVGDFYASGHLTVDLGGRHGSESFTDHIVKSIRR